MAHYAKSLNGRTEWVLDNGRLSEVGPYSPKFTLTAADTAILKNLLCMNNDEIDKAAEHELRYIRMTDRGIEESRIVSDDTVEGTVEDGDDVA
jgi:hypothetical protein